MANGKKPIKLLPPYRTAILKQFEILRAFGIATGAEPRTVTNAEVARLVDLKPDTVSLGNTFFASIGLLTKAEGGHIPAEVLIQYARANEWDPEKSFRQASRIIQDSWFAQELLPKLRMRPMSRDEIIGLLGLAAGVGPESRAQLDMLIYYLEQAGLIEEQNGSYRPRSTADAPAPPSTSPPKQDPPTPPPPPPNRSEGGGGIELSINFNVDMAEMAKWSPDRITSFMSGLAQVLTAKGQIESLAQ